MDRNEPEEDARQIAGEPLAELPAGILTPGIDRFRPSFYGRPIHHGCDEQIFGADEQGAGRGQSDLEMFGLRPGPFRHYVSAGGIVSYGSDLASEFRSAAG